VSAGLANLAPARIILLYNCSLQLGRSSIDRAERIETDRQTDTCSLWLANCDAERFVKTCCEELKAVFMFVVQWLRYYEAELWHSLQLFVSTIQDVYYTECIIYRVSTIQGVYYTECLLYRCLLYMMSLKSWVLDKIDPDASYSQKLRRCTRGIQSAVTQLWDQSCWPATPHTLHFLSNFCHIHPLP
jgi:hypothetical protein